jgi:hypothetical protein
MKREARNHSKMKRICRKLDIPVYQAVGLMESIWHVTATEAWRGDIGKLTNEDIAIAIDYRGDENNLIDALVGCGWLDVSAEHRLLVHDWPEHADQAVQKRAERSEKSGQLGFYMDMSGKVRTKALNGSLPEPEPVPVPDPEPVQKPSRAKKARAAKDGPTKTDLANGRHAEFKGLIEKYWNSVNLDIAMPWDGQEGRNLEIWLRGNPGVTAQQFRRFLYNRSKSDVNQGDRPGLWVRSMTSYARGPIDRFKNTATGNGVPIPAAHPSQEKQNADDERAREMWESMSDVYREAHPWKA